MKIVTTELEGVTRLSFSAPIQSVKGTGESHNAFEERTWKERLHVMPSGEVFIPPMMLKNCLAAVAKHLSETVPGKGKATYTKHFKAGIMVNEPMMLGVNKDEVQGERLFVPSDGRAGGGSRVWKTFPFIDMGWKTQAEIILLDPILIDKPDKVKEYLGFAGKFIGFGRFRPSNGGYYGRFKVNSFKVNTLTEQGAA